MKHILIVDDDTSYSTSLKNILEMKKFKVDVISNPFNVEKFLSDHRPDCILLDFKMPGLSGIDLLKQIRSKYQKLPIIIISAIEIKHMKVNPLMIGANLYIEKPFEIEFLLKAIAYVTQ